MKKGMQKIIVLVTVLLCAALAQAEPPASNDSVQNNTIPQASQPTATGWMGKILVLEQRKYWKTLLDEAQRWTNSEPKNELAWNKLGDVYLQSNQPTKAIEAFQRAISINPDYAIAWNNLGYAYDDLQQFTKAVEAYEKAISIKPDYFDAWNNMGVAYESSGHTSKLMDVYKRLKTIDKVQAEEFFKKFIIP